ncbi:MAG: hypothetical protein IT377_30315 [Polyangiaceae bacterium]|nr:hypothetical protein [Polyangiaceae bacterium]
MSPLSPSIRRSASLGALVWIALATGCGLQRRYGLPPAAPASSAVDCSRSPASPRCQSASPAEPQARFEAPASGGEWWLARRSSGYLCRLPCSHPVADASSLDLVEVRRSDGTERTLAVPPLPPTARGETPVVAAKTGRGSVWPGATAVALGEVLLFGGVGLFFTRKEDGCGGSWSTQGPGCTLAKTGLVAGPVLAAAGGAYWLFYYQGDDVRVSIGHEL